MIKNLFSKQSSEELLGSIRKKVGNHAFRRLLDLYKGSALSIVIDTTDSMHQEIDAVKQQAHQIVEKTTPELLILVPYDDPCKSISYTKNIVIG